MTKIKMSCNWCNSEPTVALSEALIAIADPENAMVYAQCPECRADLHATVRSNSVAVDLLRRSEAGVITRRQTMDDYLRKFQGEIDITDALAEVCIREVFPQTDNTTGSFK